MKKFVILFTMAATIWATGMKSDSTVSVVLTPADTVKIVAEPQKKRNYDYRYQVAGGVAMMLFFGLAIGTSESMNPR